MVAVKGRVVAWPAVSIDVVDDLAVGPAGNAIAADDRADRQRAARDDLRDLNLSFVDSGFESDFVRDNGAKDLSRDRAVLVEIRPQDFRRLVDGVVQRAPHVAKLNTRGIAEAEKVASKTP